MSVRLPPAVAGLEPALPSSWYRSDAVFALEKERIFCREWLCVAREEELARPGDHRVLSLFGESILLVRNREGVLRAFYNVCRHRGARLCRDATPSAPRQATPPADLVLRGGRIVTVSRVITPSAPSEPRISCTVPGVKVLSCRSVTLVSCCLRVFTAARSLVVAYSITELVYAKLAAFPVPVTSKPRPVSPVAAWLAMPGLPDPFKILTLTLDGLVVRT